MEVAAEEIAAVPGIRITVASEDEAALSKIGHLLPVRRYDRGPDLVLCPSRRRRKVLNGS